MTEYQESQRFVRLYHITGFWMIAYISGFKGFFSFIDHILHKFCTAPDLKILNWSDWHYPLASIFSQIEWTVEAQQFQNVCTRIWHKKCTYMLEMLCTGVVRFQFMLYSVRNSSSWRLCTWTMEPMYKRIKKLIDSQET